MNRVCVLQPVEKPTMRGEFPQEPVAVAIGFSESIALLSGMDVAP